MDTEKNQKRNFL